MSLLRLHCSCLLTIALTLSSTASRANADAHRDTQLLSANPETPVSSLAWEYGMHAMIGVRIPLIDAESGEGFVLSVPGLFANYNFGSEFQLIPNENWRGRLSLDAGYSTRLGSESHPLQWTASLLLEHESDHWNAFTLFVNVNSISARNVFTWEFGAVALTAVANARIHVLMCTSDPSYCSMQMGSGGSQTFEVTADLIVNGPIAPSRWRYFGAINVTYVVPNEWAGEERRFIMQAGVNTRASSKGLFAFYLALALGDDAGAFRGMRGVTGSSVGQVRPGAGFRWHF